MLNVKSAPRLGGKDNVAGHGQVFRTPRLTLNPQRRSCSPQVDDPFAHIGRIRNAGALFLGRYTPEAVGDYIAGPNHVLPTAGTARFSSALSVSHFTKKTSLIHYPKAAFDRDARDIMCLANTEGLEAHAKSIAIRTRN